MKSAHEQSLIEWAEFVRDNPRKWKKQHTAFINAQFQKHEDFVKRMLKTKKGKEKVELLFS